MLCILPLPAGQQAGKARCCNSRHREAIRPPGRQGRYNYIAGIGRFHNFRIVLRYIAALAFVGAVRPVVQGAFTAVIAQIMDEPVDIIRCAGIMLAAIGIKMAAVFPDQLAAGETDPLAGDGGVISALTFQIPMITDAVIDVADIAAFMLRFTAADERIACRAGVMLALNAQADAAVFAVAVVQAVAGALIAVSIDITFCMILRGAAHLTDIVHIAVTQMAAVGRVGFAALEADIRR